MTGVGVYGLWTCGRVDVRALESVVDQAHDGRARGAAQPTQTSARDALQVRGHDQAPL